MNGWILRKQNGPIYVYLHILSLVVVVYRGATGDLSRGVGGGDH